MTEAMPYGLNRLVRTGWRLARNVYGDALLAAAHRADRRAEPELYEEVDRILEQYRAAGGLNHHYQGYKLASLARLLREWRPRKIVEFGSGSSTAIFASYVRRNSPQNVHFHSVDQDERYLSSAKELAQIGTGDERFVLECRRRIFVRNGEWVTSVKYEGSFDVEYDFVFVDGPSLQEGPVKHKHAVCGNVFDILERHEPETIVVDGRYATALALEEYLRSRGYRCYLSDLIDEEIRPGYRYFSIFVSSRAVC